MEFSPARLMILKPILPLHRNKCLDDRVTIGQKVHLVGRLFLNVGTRLESRFMFLRHIR